VKQIDLSGRWQVDIGDGTVYDAFLPGTLDENKIGQPDSGNNQWHPDANLGAGSELTSQPGIATRLTRNYTYEGAAVFFKTAKTDRLTDGRVFLEAERTRMLHLCVNGEDVPTSVPGTISTPSVFELTGRLTGEDSLELISDNSYPGWPHDAIVFSSAATDETQTNWNGILGYLRLRFEKQVFLSAVRVYPHENTVTVKAEINAAAPYTGMLNVQSAALAAKACRKVSVKAGVHTIEFDALPLAHDVKRWDEFEGNLYELTVYADELDSKTVTFGVRNFGDNGKGRIALNGRNVFLRSEANCCVFPETGHMPLTVDEWTDILGLYKSYGVNCMRFHSHCPPDAAFTAADAVGMLMQPELSHWNPSTAFEDDESCNYYQLELKQIILTYANHPSFVMLTYGNELHAHKLGHERMDAIIKQARALDDTRMYANGSNVHYGQIGCDADSDFYASQKFYKMDLRGTFGGMGGEYGCGISGYINNEYPDAKTNYNKTMSELRKEYTKPVFSFEVGQYEVLPDFDEISEFKGVTSPVNYEIVKQHVDERGFADGWKRRVEATGELSLLSYREEIEAAMRTDELSGISLLGLQDFPGQGTALVGMLNSHLQPKSFDFAKPERFHAFFTDVLPLVLLNKYTYESSETLTAEVKLANYGKQMVVAPTVYELLDGKTAAARGELPATTCPPGGLTVCGTINIPLSGIEKAKKLMLTVTIGSAKNQYPIWVYPDEPVMCPDGAVTVRTLAEAETALAEGKTVFLSPEATIDHFPKSIGSQFTTDFWSVGTFNGQEGSMGCLMNPSHPVFAKFPTEEHTDWQWWPMVNGRAVELPPEIDPIITVIDCYARLRKFGLLFECKAGKGKLLISGMGLFEKKEYPEVRALLRSIYSYLISEKFAPAREVSFETLHELVKD
jgi:hypothetical protein